MEVPVFRAAVALRREDDGRTIGDPALHKEDLGLLAGLEDAQLRVDGALGRDDPIGPRLRPATQRLDIEPGGPPLNALVEFVVRREIDHEAGVDVPVKPVVR